MKCKGLSALLLLISICVLPSAKTTRTGIAPATAEANIHTSKIDMVIDYGNKASIISLSVNGQQVISSANGIFTSLKIKGVTYSSLHLKTVPVVTKIQNSLKIAGINYGDDNLTINETWILTTRGNAIKWNIIRKLSRPVEIDEADLPVFNFENINTWEGAYQGYGGLAWFYLFNEKLCTYGVHTGSSDFWNSKTNNGLSVHVDAPGKKVAMKYCRKNNDELAYSIIVSDKDMVPKLDSGTNRRRFLRKRTDVWAPFAMTAGTSSQSITLTYFNFTEKYGRGKMVGVNGKQVSDVLNTIAHIGVIDSLHFGGNSWATPYGPICLHEQYISQLGLAINDPNYLNGYKSCLDYYRDHAILPDGRVYPRWAYTNEDAMTGRFNKDGFYEAQWGILMDSNPDFVTNVAELYDLTGDKKWVMSHQLACEKALAWILKRDGNNNGLVETMNDNHSEKQSSDWIDIIWASYENAFVNAKLYHALVKWAEIELQLNNPSKAKFYKEFAARLKASFNKPTSQGGFWDQEKQIYDYWRDRDNTMHGRNMVTPVNFMAIAYGICDDDSRRKLILDSVEAQMQREKLFFWPLAMSSYAPDEGKEYQYPFPIYENGDLFLSWGSIAIKAYAEYKPELALKYVKNVLEQFSKDGLAFQRYGRVKQDGLGDDILSGNSLTIVGLYQAIYGINPLYNRLYLDPHITPELAGTELKYKFRNQRLTIGLNNNSFSVSNNVFKVSQDKSFGFNAFENQLLYFEGNHSKASLQVTTDQPLAIKINHWTAEKKEWQQTVTKHSAGPIVYTVHQLKSNATYVIFVNGKAVQTLKSDINGSISLHHRAKESDEKINIDRR